MIKLSNYKLTVEIHDFKDICFANESGVIITKVKETAFGNERFDSFLRRTAEKYNRHENLIYHLLNGNDLIWKEYFDDNLISHLATDYLYDLGDLAEVTIADLVENFRIDKKRFFLGSMDLI